MLLRAAGWLAQATLLSLFWCVARSLPARRAAAAGRSLFSRLGPRSGRQRVVDANLAQAFPALDAAQRSALSREVWGNFGAVLAEYPHLRRLRHREVDLEVRIDERARALVAAGTPAVYVTAHLANWELAGAALARAGVPLSVVYAPQGNPLLDRMLQWQRRSLGCAFIGKRQALRKVMRELRAGRSVGMLTDQRIDAGAPVPFFGRDALTATTPAWLALKMRCPLLPVQIVRRAEGRYRAILHAPVEAGQAAPDDDAVWRLTARLNQVFESWIRERPQQWLCMRRRWSMETLDAARRRA